MGTMKKTVKHRFDASEYSGRRGAKKDISLAAKANLTTIPAIAKRLEKIEIFLGLRKADNKQTDNK